MQSKVVQRQKALSSFSPYLCRSNDMGAFAGSHLKAELRKRPSYFEVLAASGEIATFIVDCTCTGSLLQWFPELTFDKTDPLWICDDDRILHSTHWVFWLLSSWWLSVLCICWADHLQVLFFISFSVQTTKTKAALTLHPGWRLWERATSNNILWSCAAIH